MTALRFTTLLDWVEGRLDEAAARTVAVRVEADPRAQEVVAWIQEFHAAADAGSLAEPPAPLRAELHSLFTRLQGASRPGREGSLSFDSRDQQVSGIRSPAPDLQDLEHVVVVQESVRILLTLLRGSHDEMGVTGRVEHHAVPGESEAAPSVPAEGEIVLVAPGRPMRVARLEHDGTFELAGVSQDVTEVWFLGGAVELRASLSSGRP